MKPPELVSNKPDEKVEKEEEQQSAFPVFDKLRRERIAEEAGTPLPDPPAKPSPP